MKHKIIYKNKSVEAIQFDGTWDNLRAIQDLIKGTHCPLVAMVTLLTNDFVLGMPSRQQSGSVSKAVRVTSWVIKDDNCIKTMTHESFVNIYKEIK